MKRRRKKSNNPFKMWGSWIGIILLVAVVLGLKDTAGNLAYTLSQPLYRVLCIITQKCSGSFLAGLGEAILALLITVGIIGFLLGWGIHSLFRRLRR